MSENEHIVHQDIQADHGKDYQHIHFRLFHASPIAFERAVHA